VQGGKNSRLNQGRKKYHTFLSFIRVSGNFFTQPN
jgi:hypothetical protein